MIYDMEFQCKSTLESYFVQDAATIYINKCYGNAVYSIIKTIPYFQYFDNFSQCTL